MARDITDTTPVWSRDELVAWFERGCKSAEAFRIGTEHEKFPFYRADLSPVPYAETQGRGGIRAILEGLGERLAWEAIVEEGNPIGLANDGGTAPGGAISLEPGGQFELSGAPVATLHETDTELAEHLAHLAAVAGPLGIGFLALGASPKWPLEATPAMPKGRYRIMANYMPKVGTRGLDMMFRTSTVQVNLDYASEADMVRKLRVSVALQPVATALFANSPFTDGRPNGFRSVRSHIWLDTDLARSGMLPFVFEPGMGFERYVDYALDVPMYFVKRGSRYHDVTGMSFRDLLAGDLKALPGERATLSDWANHLSTIFPEVRLKRYLEMRGADVGSPAMITALGALFVGLLYDETALDAAAELVSPWDAEARQALREAVPGEALAARIGGQSVREVAAEILTLARGGLERRARRNAAGQDETHFLDPLDAIVERGRSTAEDLLERYHGPWQGSVDPAFTECIY
jgi:glutamate--cysteine ligase